MIALHLIHLQERFCASSSWKPSTQYGMRKAFLLDSPHVGLHKEEEAEDKMGGAIIRQSRKYKISIKIGPGTIQIISQSILPVQNSELSHMRKLTVDIDLWITSWNENIKIE